MDLKHGCSVSLCVFILLVFSCIELNVALKLNLTYIGPPMGRDPRPSISNANAYLIRFGFHTMARDATTTNLTPEELQAAVRKFQMRVGLNPSGKLDERTLNKMREPRCGAPDMQDVHPGMNYTMVKGRFQLAQGSVKWNQPTELKYFIENFSTDMPEEKFRQGIKDAWSYWETVANLKAIEVKNKADAKLTISFGRGEHGDGPYAMFDGPNGVLAHAYFPQDGRIHFDDDELYTEGVEDGYNFRIVAAHEFGHALGLDHSNIGDALMAPFYSGYIPKTVCLLNKDDIAGIRTLYGRGGRGDVGRCGPALVKEEVVVTQGPTVKTTAAPLTTSAPERIRKPAMEAGQPNPCKMSIDAIWMGLDYHYHVVRGNYIFRVSRKGEVVEVKKARTYFERFPKRPDAAAYSSRHDRLYVFKDKRVFVYNRDGRLIRVMRAGNPDYPSKKKGVSKAAFTDNQGKIKIIFGADVFEFNEADVDAIRKVGTTDIFNLPGKSMHAAAADVPEIGKEQFMYLFYGTKYYKVDAVTLKVLDGYKNPKPAADAFFGCSGVVVPK